MHQSSWCKRCSADFKRAACSAASWGCYKHDLHHGKVEENEHLNYMFPYGCSKSPGCWNETGIPKPRLEIRSNLPGVSSNSPMDGPRKVDHIAPSASDQLPFWNPPRRTVALSYLGLVKWNQQSKEPIVCHCLSIYPGKTDIDPCLFGR